MDADELLAFDVVKRRTIRTIPAPGVHGVLAVPALSRVYASATDAHELYTIDAVQTDNNLALLFVPEAVGITTAVAGASEVLFGLTAELLRPFFETARAAGELRAGVDLDDAAEWVQRTVLSLLTFPGPVQRSPEEQRRFLRTFLVPALVTRHRPEATAPALPRERAERS